MPMAGGGVHLRTHERCRMVYAVEKGMQIAAEVLRGDVKVVPVPQGIARRLPHGEAANVSRDTQVGIVNVLDAVPGEMPLQFRLGEVRLVLADGRVSDIDYRGHTGLHE